MEVTTVAQKAKSKFNKIFAMANKDEVLNFLFDFNPAGVFRKSFDDTLTDILESSKTGEYKELMALTSLIGLLEAEPLTEGVTLLEYIYNVRVDHHNLVLELMGEDSWLLIEKREVPKLLDITKSIIIYLNIKG